MLRVLVIAVMLSCEIRPSRFSVALVAMINLASGVWTLLSDDLSSVIFRQSTLSFSLYFERHRCIHPHSALDGLSCPIADLISLRMANLPHRGLELIQLWMD